MLSHGAQSLDADPISLDAIKIITDEANKKEEEKKAIAAAIDIKAIKEEFSALIQSIQLAEKKFETAREEEIEAQHQAAKEKQDTQVSLQLYAELEKKRVEFMKHVSESVTQLESKIKTLELEIQAIKKAWGADTYEEGLKHQAETIDIGADGITLAQKAKDIFLAAISPIDMDKTIDAVSLRAELNAKIDAEVKAFKDSVAHPNGSKDPIVMEMQVLGIARKIDVEFVPEFNRKIKEFNRTHPNEKPIELIKLERPPGYLKSIIDYANTHQREVLDVFQSNMRSFLAIDNLVAAKSEFTTQLSGVTAVSNRYSQSSLPPMSNVAMRIDPSTSSQAPYDCDAGTRFSSENLSNTLMSYTAKSIQSKIGSRVSVEESGNYVKFTVGNDPANHFVYNRATMTIAANNANRDAVNAMLLFATKVNGAKPLDVVVDSNANVDALSQVSKRVGLNVGFKQVGAVAQDMPKPAVTAKSDVVVAPVSDSVPVAPPMSSPPSGASR